MKIKYSVIIFLLVLSLLLLLFPSLINTYAQKQNQQYKGKIEVEEIKIPYIIGVEKIQRISSSKVYKLLFTIDNKYIKDRKYNNTYERTIIVSPNLQRYAIIFRRRGETAMERRKIQAKEFVVLDGKEHKGYDNISEAWFTADSKYFIYRAEGGTNDIIVINDKEKLYEQVKQGGKASSFGSITFSPDGKRFGYIVGEGCYEKEEISEAGHKGLLKKCKNYFVVVDGIEGKKYENIRDLIFSPNGQRVAYIVDEGNKNFVVVDGEEGKKYNEILSLSFSFDGKRIAYLAWEGKSYAEREMLVVVDGKESKRYRDINIMGGSIFSPNGQHYAYKAVDYSTQSIEEFIVFDGEEGKKYDKIINFTFSPDGEKFVYIAQKDNKNFLVFNGEEREIPYNIIDLKFSPNGQNLAYIARAYIGNNNNKSFVVVDGIERKKYDYIERLIFSEDSSNLAYVAYDGDNTFVVANEEEGKKYNKDKFKLHPFFESNQLIYIVDNYSQEPRFSYPVINNQEYPNINGRIIFSPDKKQFAYRSIKDINNFKEIVILNGREIGKPFTMIKELLFSPNSKYLIYIGYEEADDKEFLFINGKDIEEIEEYNEFVPYTNWERTDDFYNFYKIFSFSSDGKNLMYVVRRGNQIWKVDVELK